MLTLELHARSNHTQFTAKYMWLLSLAVSMYSQPFSSSFEEVHSLELVSLLVVMKCILWHPYYLIGVAQSVVSPKVMFVGLCTC